jgi:hypothetical protein
MKPTRDHSRRTHGIAGAVADMFDALIATMIDTRLEPDLEDLLWSPSTSSIAP